MNQSIPEDVRAAWDRGDKVDAIRLLRKHTGLGLKEAKEALESGSRTMGFGPVSIQVVQKTLQTTHQLPASVSAAIQSGDKIEAIRLVRESTGLGLKEAKDLVDSLDAALGGGASARTPDLAPGEIPRAKFNPVWLAALVIAAVAVGWLVLGRT